MPVNRPERWSASARATASRRFTKFLILVPVLAFGLAVVGCSLGSGNPTPPAARSVTQTPWVVYVPVTTTPEPATVTPLPTVTTAARISTRTPTRSAPVPTKAAVVPTKAPTQPVVVVAPSATAAPACSASSVTLLFPKDGDPRRTKSTGPSSDTFRFQWTPFQAGQSEPQMGYRIDIESKKGNVRVNGDTVYVSHNNFLSENQMYIYDSRRIYNLASPAGGDNVTVTWKVTVIKTSGSFDGQGGVTGTTVSCSPPSQTWTIRLMVED